MTAPAALPPAFHVATPHGTVGLWWLDLPACSPAHRRQLVRRQAAALAQGHYPAWSPSCIHWPADGSAPVHDRSAPAPASAGTERPGLWLSWSYRHPLSSGEQPAHALLAMAPFPVGVDVSSGSLLALQAWSGILRLYGGIMQAPQDPHACACMWTCIEAADKCLRTGLREWSEAVAQQRNRCTVIQVPVPHQGVAAALAVRAR